MSPNLRDDLYLHSLGVSPAQIPEPQPQPQPSIPVEQFPTYTHIKCGDSLIPINDYIALTNDLIITTQERLQGWKFVSVLGWSGFLIMILLKVVGR